MNKNIVSHTYKVNREARSLAKGHNSFLLFFTGLSGSGKSTIANAVEQHLHSDGVHTFALDGDNVRGGINKDLTFSTKDRKENIRRIGEIANLFVEAGIVVLAAFIAPYNEDREQIRLTVGTANYIEIFVNTSLEVCEARDVKGLYKKARKGEIKNMTGISAPYEVPENPRIEITENQSVEEATEMVYKAIQTHLSKQK